MGVASFSSVNSSSSSRLAPSGVGTSGDGALGADLHAGIAFPAGVGFLVVRLHFLRIEDHQVVRADVHAGRLFATLAAVAFGRIDKRRHNVSSNS